MTATLERQPEVALAIEQRGVQRVPDDQRHGRPFGQFTLWFGANLTIADFALGFLPVTLGVPWLWTVVAVLIGNLLGALAVGACAPMGPSYGLPQMVLVQGAFGRLGGRLPAGLNYVSTLGWYTVNTILGAFGLRLLFPSLSFWQGALLLVLGQGVLAVYGHNLVHRFERVMSMALGVLFLIVTVDLLSSPHRLAAYHPAGHSVWASFAIVVAATFSYVGSWSPYAADYSRYLPADTRRSAVTWAAFVGSFVGSVWLELLGAAVAVVAGKAVTDPTAAAHVALGRLGGVAVVAIILGAVAANAVNLYSNSLAAGAVGLRAPRWALAVAASVVGLVLSLVSFGSFAHNYEEFLLFLGYWITPWLGVQLVDFYLLRGDRRGLDAAGDVRRVAVAAFVLGVLAEIPFMSSTVYTGPITRALGGADLSFYVGFLVAAAGYLLARRTAGAGRAGAG
ncbi:MAG: cytosine permease [Actinomycetota bacterium]|nr:cytosine permease [Actinomycetota bacterium]